jgi:hypothetical protein
VTTSVGESPEVAGRGSPVEPGAVVAGAGSVAGVWRGVDRAGPEPEGAAAGVGADDAAGGADGARTGAGASGAAAGVGTAGVLAAGVETGGVATAGVETGGVEPIGVWIGGTLTGGACTDGTGTDGTVTVGRSAPAGSVHKPVPAAPAATVNTQRRPRIALPARS